MKEFIAYRRIAPTERGRKGLALQDQAAAILRYVQSRGGVLVQDFVEAEPGKGSDLLERRPRLREAMDAAVRRHAVLVVARLDRLSRDVDLLSMLVVSGVDFAAADIPEADATMLHAHATIAASQRERSAKRISSALQAKKQAALAHGLPNPVGHPASLQPHNTTRQQAAQAFAEKLAPRLAALREAGLTQRQIVDTLNEQGIRTAAGGTWSLVQLQRVLARRAG